VRILLDAGAAEAEWNGCDLDDLIEIAKGPGSRRYRSALDEVPGTAGRLRRQRIIRSIRPHERGECPERSRHP